MIVSGAGALILATAARGGFTQPGDAATIAHLAALDGLTAVIRSLRDTDAAVRDTAPEPPVGCST